MSTFFSPVNRQKLLGSGDKATSSKSRTETTVWASILLVSGTVFLAAAFSFAGSNSPSNSPATPTTLTPTSGPPASQPVGVPDSTTTTTEAPTTTTTTTPPTEPST